MLSAAGPTSTGTYRSTTAGPASDAPRLDLRSAATSKIATAKFSSYTPIHLSRSVQNRVYYLIAKRGSAALDIGQGGGG